MFEALANVRPPHKTKLSYFLNIHNFLFI